MTYDELIELIEKGYDCELCRLFFGEESCKNHTCMEVGKEIARIAYEAGLREGGLKLGSEEHAEYKAGYEDAASNHEAWYMLDKNGEKVHLLDKVKLSNGEQVIVHGLTHNGIYSIPAGHGVILFEPNHFEKILPDSEEKIKEELGDIILALVESDVETDVMDKYEIYTVNELVDQFYNRIADQVTKDIEADVQKRVMGDA